MGDQGTQHLQNWSFVNLLECNCPRWALLFTEAPKELPDRNIHLVVIEMATMSVKHILKVLFIVSKAKMVVGRES